MKAYCISSIFAVLLLASGCKKQTAIDDPLLRSWVSSEEVLNRREPAIFSSQRADGSTVAIATGDFVEIQDGIDLNSEAVLPTGFYVFPGRVRVDTIEEAIAFCERSPGRKYKTEPAAGDNG